MLAGKRILSLEEMLILLASELTKVWPKLTDLQVGFAMGGNDAPTEEEVAALNEIKRLASSLGWSDLGYQTGVLLKHIRDKKPDAVLKVLTEDLQEAFSKKAHETKLVAVVGPDSLLLEGAAKAICGPLNPDLSIPEEELDLAGKCISLGLSTASVAHAMRSIEASLHALCKVLGITFPGSIELQDWKVLTEKISADIKTWDAKPRSPEKTNQQKELGELLTAADGFRLAWRNHVAHAREKYQDDEARKIIRYVGDFLKRLSAIIGS